MSFSRIVSGKMAANNKDKLRLNRETQHAYVRCERTGIQNEHAKVRWGTIHRPYEGEALTFKSRLS